MNADLITKAMGKLDLKYVDEAAAYTRPRRRRAVCRTRCFQKVTTVL